MKSNMFCVGMLLKIKHHKGGLCYTLVLLTNVPNTHAITENEASCQGQMKSFKVGLINSLRKLFVRKPQCESIERRYSQINGTGYKSPTSQYLDFT